jgi:hypothetical protein
LESFTKCGGNLRLAIATSAFGMGTDCQDVRRIIHWGIPNTLKEYVQEIGQSSQGGEHSVAVFIIYEKKGRTSSFRVCGGFRRLGYCIDVGTAVGSVGVEACVVVAGGTVERLGLSS